MSQRGNSRDSWSRLTSNTMSSASRLRETATAQSQKRGQFFGMRSNSQPNIPTVNEFVKFSTRSDQQWGISNIKMAK